MASSSSSASAAAAAIAGGGAAGAGEKERRKANRKMPGAIKRAGQRIAQIANATKNVKDLDRNFPHYPRYVPASRLACARAFCTAYPVQPEDMEKAKEECMENRPWILFLPEVANRVLLSRDPRWRKDSGKIVPPCPCCQNNKRVERHRKSRDNIAADNITIIDDYDSATFLYCRCYTCSECEGKSFHSIDSIDQLPSRVREQYRFFPSVMATYEDPEDRRGDGRDRVQPSERQRAPQLRRGFTEELGYHLLKSHLVAKGRSGLWEGVVVFVAVVAVLPQSPLTQHKSHRVSHAEGETSERI